MVFRFKEINLAVLEEFFLNPWHWCIMEGIVFFAILMIWLVVFANNPIPLQTLIRKRGDDMIRNAVIIDDDADTLDASSRLLRKKGFAVRKFFVTAKALKYFSKNRTNTNLILVDHDMPGMDGPTLIKEIKKIISNAVFIGMSADRKNEERFYKVECYGFLKKPFGSEDLISILKSLRFL